MYNVPGIGLDGGSGGQASPESVVGIAGPWLTQFPIDLKGARSEGRAEDFQDQHADVFFENISINCCLLVECLPRSRD